MNCPKCSCERSVKSGIIKGRHRYKCKECGCNYTVEFKSTAKPKSMKRQEIEIVEMDEMHSYIGTKKTIAGYGLLLIDMEKDSSISLLATGATRQQKRFGKR